MKSNTISVAPKIFPKISESLLIGLEWKGVKGNLFGRTFEIQKIITQQFIVSSRCRLSSEVYLKS